MPRSSSFLQRTWKRMKEIKPLTFCNLDRTTSILGSLLRWYLPVLFLRWENQKRALSLHIVLLEWYQSNFWIFTRRHPPCFVVSIGISTKMLACSTSLQKTKKTLASPPETSNLRKKPSDLLQLDFTQYSVNVNMVTPPSGHSTTFKVRTKQTKKLSAPSRRSSQTSTKLFHFFRISDAF